MKVPKWDILCVHFWLNLDHIYRPARRDISPPVIIHGKNLAPMYLYFLKRAPLDGFGWKLVQYGIYFVSMFFKTKICQLVAHIMRSWIPFMLLWYQKQTQSYNKACTQTQMFSFWKTRSTIRIPKVSIQ